MIQGRRILMVIAPKDFRDEELFKPKKAFEEAGAQVTIASKGVSVAKGMLGGTIGVERDLKDVSVGDYDAVVFVGGSGASEYFDDTIALDLAKEAYDKGKIVGAICIAPVILANAGILKDKKATVWSSLLNHSHVNALKEKGAIYTGEKITKDGMIITASGPDAAELFADAIIKALEE